MPLFIDECRVTALKFDRPLKTNLFGLMARMFHSQSFISRSCPNSDSVNVQWRWVPVKIKRPQSACVISYSLTKCIFCMISHLNDAAFMYYQETWRRQTVAEDLNSGKLVTSSYELWTKKRWNDARWITAENELAFCGYCCCFAQIKQFDIFRNEAKRRRKTIFK